MMVSNTQERIRQRRRYLLQKEWAYARMGLHAVLIVPLTLLAFLLMVFVSLWLPVSAFILFCMIVVFVFSYGVIVRLCLRSALNAHREAKQIAYVPPVTRDTLPAEEVLVRGSEEPEEEQRKVLLRGTDGSADTGEQELLRSSQGQGQG